MTDDFLLQSERAIRWYNQYAKDLPIIDYHCHLNPKEIYENKPFTSLGQAWLAGDHYKWRLMRTAGFEENLVSGSAEYSQKMAAFAQAVECAIGNPVYHWVHMELKQFFQIHCPFTTESLPSIVSKADSIIQQLTPQKILSLCRVEALCTTDDPLDDLSYHDLIERDSNITTKVYPTFRPDFGFRITHPKWQGWFERFEVLAKKKITTIEMYLEVLRQRMDYFAARGCRLSDHAIDEMVYENCDETQAELIFQKRIRKESISRQEQFQFQTFILLFLAKEYTQRGWVQQYHIGALRNVHELKFQMYGADFGFDAIGSGYNATALAQLLNGQAKNHSLPKTVLYPLNQNDFDSATTIMQVFQDGEGIGKLQLGSAWWFMDHLEGIEKQLSSMAQNGLLSTFIGMLTDSRSFLSFSRHDYFRRIVCNFIASQVNRGLFPNDERLIERLIVGISYSNVKRYLQY